MIKAAMISMTKVFAAECAPWIVKVNALVSEITDTCFAAALVHGVSLLRQYKVLVPIDRIPQPQEIAGTVLHLAPGVSYMIGVRLPVDGGWLIN